MGIRWGPSGFVMGYYYDGFKMGLPITDNSLMGSAGFLVGLPSMGSNWVSGVGLQVCSLDFLGITPEYPTHHTLLGLGLGLGLELGLGLGLGIRVRD